MPSEDTSDTRRVRGANTKAGSTRLPAAGRVRPSLPAPSQGKRRARAARAARTPGRRGCVACTAASLYALGAPRRRTLQADRSHRGRLRPRARRILLGGRDPELNLSRAGGYRGAHEQPRTRALNVHGATSPTRSEPISSDGLRLSAEIASFCVANSQQAVKHHVTGISVRSKIVSAVGELRAPQAVRINRPSAVRQRLACSHLGHTNTKPPGHRSHFR